MRENKELEEALAQHQGTKLHPRSFRTRNTTRAAASRSSSRRTRT